MPVGRPSSQRQLAHCREEALTCHECVRNTATQVARLAADPHPGSLRQLFFSMYPDRACHGMAGAFIQIVNEIKPARRSAATAAAPVRFHVAVA